MENASVDKLIEEFGHLPLEDMEYVAEIIQKQLIDMKRSALAARAQEAKKDYIKGFTKAGSIKEIMEDLEGD